LTTWLKDTRFSIGHPPQHSQNACEIKIGSAVTAGRPFSLSLAIKRGSAACSGKDQLFSSNFLSGMHGFQDNEVLLQGGCDVIVISPPGSAGRNFLIADSERATPILY